jgi:hypothetical protein
MLAALFRYPVKNRPLSRFFLLKQPQIDEFIHPISCRLFGYAETVANFSRYKGRVWRNHELVKNINPVDITVWAAGHSGTLLLRNQIAG